MAQNGDNVWNCKCPTCGNGGNVNAEWSYGVCVLCNVINWGRMAVCACGGVAAVCG